MYKTPLQFWTQQRQYLEAELLTCKTEHERNAVQEGIDECSGELEKINNGTYEEPAIGHQVFTIYS